MRKFTSHLSLRGGGLCHRSNLFITGEIDFLAQVRNLRKVAIVCLLMAVGLAGCSRLVSVQQPVVQSSLLLASGQTIGQTFVAEFDGLASVQFYLSPQTPGDGTIFLHLRTDPQSPTDLGLAAIPVEKISAPGFYSFYFTPQSHSFKTSYYAFLEILGTGSVGVGNAAANAYLNGALYQDGTAVEAQSAFRLTYSRRWAGLGLVLELLNWVGVLLAGSFVFVLPGVAEPVIAGLESPNLGGETWPGGGNQPGVVPAVDAVGQLDRLTPGGGVCLGTATDRWVISPME
jgi:hypothetical protein